MYDYLALRIDCSPCSETVTDLVADSLAEVGFESFEPDELGVTSYIRQDLYDENKVKEVLEDFPLETDFCFSVKLIKGEDWNREWEQNYFQPINIDDECVVRSSFHKNAPKAPIEILIDPKMAFGTGHHSTTAGMIRLLLKENLEGKSIIDMGTGTGILAILCKKSGSSTTTAIEIDHFALENAKENGVLNEVKIDWIEGNADSLDKIDPSDYFLANINLNVILSDFDSYISKLKSGGKILLSGFYQNDIQFLQEKFLKYNLKEEEKCVDKDWVAIKLRKM